MNEALSTNPIPWMVSQRSDQIRSGSGSLGSWKLSTVSPCICPQDKIPGLRKPVSKKWDWPLAYSYKVVTSLPYLREILSLALSFSPPSFIFPLTKPSLPFPSLTKQSFHSKASIVLSSHELPSFNSPAGTPTYLVSSKTGATHDQVSGDASSSWHILSLKARLARPRQTNVPRRGGVGRRGIGLAN